MVIPAKPSDVAIAAGERPASAPPVSSRATLVVSLLSLFLPWFLRRRLLNALCRYSIAPGARIGLSLVACAHLRMDAGARIGHFNLIKGIRLEMGEYAWIGIFNWISGLPVSAKRHFSTESGRDPALCLGRHSSLTSRHFIDCSNRVDIGEFAIVAGARSQILTHAVDLRSNSQMTAPVAIGRYCFVGTGCILLKGAKLPDYSVLAAGSTLVRAHEESFTLYSGVPALPVKPLERDWAYFSREIGWVD